MGHKIPEVGTEEELRLLGRSRQDPNAISISTPTSRHQYHVMPGLSVLHGGVQPQNTLSNPQSTLSRPFSLHGPAGSRRTVPIHRRGAQRALAVEVHCGNNVHKMSHATEFDELNLAQPSAKRQKTTHPVSSPRSGLSDPLDQLPPDFIHFGPNHSQSTNGALSIHSQGSGFQIKRTGTSVGSLPEFKNVERMMDSNPKNRKNKRGKDSQTSKHDPKLLPSSPKSTSVNHPIDISGDDEVKEVDSIPAVIPPRRYQGTARNPPLTVSGIQKPNISKAHQSRSTEKRSPYFNSSTPTIDINGKAKQWSIQPASQSLTGEPTERLAQQFVATDGKRRGSDVNMSSDVDELSAVNTTVGNRADPNAIFSAKNPHLDSNSKDSSSTVRVTSPTKEDGGLPPSTVKPSIFVNGEPKSQISTRPSRGRLREEKPPWAIDVAAVRIGSRLCQVTDGLALVYDARSQTYGLRKEGKATSFGIQPDKLLRIIFGNSGRKVRFESAKTQHEESTLDLEFRKEKDVKEVVDKLSNESGCKILSRESDHMDKVFDRRLKEFEKNSISNTGNALALGNRPWHQVNTEIAVKEIEDSKRPKRVVDRLQDDDNGNHDTKAARVGLRISGIPNGRSEVTKKTGLLESLKPLHNGHLNPRRSTRNFGSNEQVLQSLSSTFDDIPVQEKYSKKQGLGDPWKKPLTYPKVGKKKTTVEWSDLERLDEGEFLNDNLISFYLRFLEQSLEEDRPDIARRVYFFNTFFFATLTNSHKGKKAFNYEGVQKWTRSVDLFTYDYIIVPINEHAHWYLAIICNLPALDRSIEIVERDSEPSSPRAAPVTEDENLGQSDQFLSMPANELDVGDSRTLTSERLKEPDESEARNSFAEMSLENDNQTIPAHRPDFTRSGNAEDEDKEMLDAQIEETLPGFIPSEDARHHPAVSANDQADAADELVKDGDQLDQGPKTTGRTKKSKRKSMLAPITKTDPSKPAIITFDSLGQSRGPTIKILKDYLREEARAKRGGMEIDATQIKGISAKLIPQQNNFSDCGLFLLGYVERFLENDPKDFVTKIIQQGVNGKIDWSKLVPSSLRASIRDQVRELNKAQTDERMESLKKASTRDDQRPELTPSRGRASVEVSEKGLDRHEGPATSKPTSPLSDLHTEIAEDFKTAAGHPNNNIDNDIIRIMQEHGQQIGDDSLEPLMQENERQIAQTSNRETNDVKKSDIRIDGGLGRLDGLSPIYVDSQSQQGMPISTTEASLPLAFDKEQSPRLPAEIPDSQGSDTARRFVQVLGREASKPWTADPHLRRDEDAATALPAETSSKQRQEHKQSSKHEQSGRGVPTGGQAWDMHEVQCINIDDD